MEELYTIFSQHLYDLGLTRSRNMKEVYTAFRVIYKDIYWDISNVEIFLIAYLVYGPINEEHQNIVDYITKSFSKQQLRPIVDSALKSNLYVLEKEDIDNILNNFEKLQTSGHYNPYSLSETKMNRKSLGIRSPPNLYKKYFQYSVINDMIGTWTSYIEQKYDACVMKRNMKLAYGIDMNIYTDHLILPTDVEFINNCKFDIILGALSIDTFTTEGFGGHENLIIFDKRNQRIYRFEPHGAEEFTITDDKLEASFKLHFDKYTYINTSNICPLGLQRLEMDAYHPNKTPRERWPEDINFGYCVVWSLIFGHYCLEFSDLEPSEVTEWILGQGNLLDRIRQYSGWLIDLHEKTIGKEDFRSSYYDYLIKILQHGLFIINDEMDREVLKQVFLRGYMTPDEFVRYYFEESPMIDNVYATRELISELFRPIGDPLSFNNIMGDIGEEVFPVDPFDFKDIIWKSIIKYRDMGSIIHTHEFTDKFIQTHDEPLEFLSSDDHSKRVKDLIDIYDEYFG